MKTIRLAAIVAGAALVGSSLLASTPASAQILSFSNPLATATNSDVDVTSLDVDFGDTTLTVTAHVDNAVGDGSFAVITGSNGAAMLTGGPNFVFGATFTGSTVTPLAQTVVGETLTNIPTDTITVTRNASANTIVATVASSRITFGNEIYFGAVLNADSSYVYAGKSLNTDIAGLGPVLKGSLATTTVVELLYPTQTHNGTPVTAKATISPATVAGTVQFFDGSTLVGTAPAAGGFAYFALPPSLATGQHLISAKFVPAVTGAYLGSSSTAVTLTVLSAAKATTTTVTLSKSTQKFKKTAVKLTVKVAGKPAGAVVIKDGKKTLETVVLKNGVAKYTFSKKLKKGSHKITATFVPTDVEAYSGSTSKAKTLKVTK